jgi:hypothetical protein
MRRNNDVYAFGCAACRIDVWARVRTARPAWPQRRSQRLYAWRAAGRTVITMQSIIEGSDATNLRASPNRSSHLTGYGSPPRQVRVGTVRGDGGGRSEYTARKRAVETVRQATRRVWRTKPRGDVFPLLVRA